MAVHVLQSQYGYPFFLQSLVAPRVVHAPPTMLFQCDSILPFLAGPGT